MNIRAVGIWGGSTEEDRAAVRGLPQAEAIAELEAGLPARIRERVEAFEAMYPRKRSHHRTARRMHAELDAMREAVGADSVADHTRNP